MVCTIRRLFGIQTILFFLKYCVKMDTNKIRAICENLCENDAILVGHKGREGLLHASVSQADGKADLFSSVS